MIVREQYQAHAHHLLNQESVLSIEVLLQEAAAQHTLHRIELQVQEVLHTPDRAAVQEVQPILHLAEVQVPEALLHIPDQVILLEVQPILHRVEVQAQVEVPLTQHQVEVQVQHTLLQAVALQVVREVHRPALTEVPLLQAVVLHQAEVAAVAEEVVVDADDDN